ncbi:transporter [Rhodococcus sp. 14-2496-1d]|uniref:SLC13 family permease n=1 Tax=Rhodococcus sp. 14-2496-1d TaxID=2023146 RepID=UPI000B9B0ECC|nr:SLC13 family permease [Rhodococcus sp. 14-2496-1d]OZF40001.1 transporter [Rhodococcus sp. 14-2496-1d]
MNTVSFRTQPPPVPEPLQSWRFRDLVTRRVLQVVSSSVALLVLLAVLAGAADGLPAAGRTTLVVFTAAVALWVFTKIDDTYVALGAALALVLTGVVSTDGLFDTLGEETIWLLIAAFIIAAGVRESGLATRAAVFIVSGAGTVRQLAHLVTAALIVTAFAIPATSGRAALALPVFLALAQALTERKRVVRALAILFPTVILLSAVATLIGAGAHLITSQVLESATGTGISFTAWLLLGVPLAVVSSHCAAELVLLLFTDREDRRIPLAVDVSDLASRLPTPVTGPLTIAENRAATLLAVVMVLWCSEPLHGVHPAVIALLGALISTSPRFGTIEFGKALATVPWSLLLFMAATLALGTALTTSGAARWLSDGLFTVVPIGSAPPWVFIAVVIVVSVASHLLIQSRSARSSVLVPLVVTTALALGVDPVAAAFASTAAAGFCHTMPSSAKPVAIFAKAEGVETYSPKDLLRLSAFLAPLTAATVLFFAVAVWPLLGTPIT